MSAHRGETDMHWLFHFLDQSFAHTIAESKFGLRPKTSQTEKPFFSFGLTDRSAIAEFYQVMSKCRIHSDPVFYVTDSQVATVGMGKVK